MVPTRQDIELTKKQIEDILNKVKVCIQNNRLQYDPNKDKNADFMYEYNLRYEDVVRIISKLTYKNFSKCTISDNSKYLNELLYIFGINEELKEISSTKAKEIVIYIKFYIIGNYGNDLTFVVSFHKAEHEIHYAFK